MSGQGNVCSGKCPSGKCQSGNCPVGELSAYRFSGMFMLPLRIQSTLVQTIRNQQASSSSMEPCSHSCLFWSFPVDGMMVQPFTGGVDRWQFHRSLNFFLVFFTFFTFFCFCQRTQFNFHAVTKYPTSFSGNVGFLI